MQKYAKHMEMFNEYEVAVKMKSKLDILCRRQMMAVMKRMCGGTWGADQKLIFSVTRYIYM